MLDCIANLSHWKLVGITVQNFGWIMDHYICTVLALNLTRRLLCNPKACFQQLQHSLNEYISPPQWSYIQFFKILISDTFWMARIKEEALTWASKTAAVNSGRKESQETDGWPTNLQVKCRMWAGITGRCRNQSRFYHSGKHLRMGAQKAKMRFRECRKSLWN